ncbi:hypothetical protein E2C01_097780 [Portunus trituberculatus]|uniref:Peptidase A2 domain-containing protein n=1 Tax=Portunus trituberculatus TaxID=210409 RepID=A0A5B7K191_PORTR|nr:hypothetical protein [Portunus trituberculatus]
MALHDVNCLHTAARAVQVDGALDGRPYRMIIDTGAESTFVRENGVSMEPLPDAQTRLCGVTGHCIRLKGPVAEVVTTAPVYLAPGIEARLHCQLSRKMHGADGLVEPTRERHLADGVAVGRSLVRWMMDG